MKTDFVFDYLSLDLSATDYLLEMGYRRHKPQSLVLDIIHTHEEQLIDKVKPLCTFMVDKGGCSKSLITLECGLSLHVGDILGYLLEGANGFAVFAATAGTEFQSYYDKVKGQDNMLSLFILDTMGSCIVEKTGDLMERCLEQLIIPHRHTARFSPGYCGWSLSEQKDIFQVLEGSPCGIVLSESCLMYPLKSISGVIGIGDRVKEKKYGCEICKLETCYKRKNKKKV